MYSLSRTSALYPDHRPTTSPVEKLSKRWAHFAKDLVDFGADNKMRAAHRSRAQPIPILFCPWNVPTCNAEHDF
jgi:hypothetical protein